MPRSYVRKKTPGYTKEHLEQAVKAVNEGASIYATAKQYKIPYETLRRWIVKNPTHRGSGRLPVFTFEEECIIIESLKFMARCGYPQDRKDLRYIVQNFVKTLPPSRIIPFNDSMPGADWIRNFEKRWSNELRNRKPELLTKSRAEAMTPTIINSFFDMHEDLLKKNNLLESPERIFNLDETGLATDARNSNVFVAKNARTAYMNSATCGKTMYTVLFCVSADGKYMPPFTVYKSLHLYDAWTRGGPHGTMYGCTDSGWMSDSVFEKWLQYFSKHVEKLTKPILLIYDGHGSHITYQIVKYAMEKQIIILCLPPHTSHALQPLDVGVFAPLKRQWKNILKIWFRESRLQSVTKSVFPLLLKKLFDNMSSDNIIKGFKGSGIYPPNRRAVDHKLTVCSTDLQVIPTTSQHSEEASEARILQSLKNVIVSPYKDLKQAIVTAISPKPSSFTVEGITNSKIKRKRVQAKAGEVLTNEEVLERLKNEKVVKKIPKKEKKPKTSNENSSEIQTEETSEIKIIPSIGDWVKIQYSKEKSKQDFIGKIMSTEENIFEVRFLHKSRIGNFYVFPETEDTDCIDSSQIIQILSEPNFNSRGHYFFK